MVACVVWKRQTEFWSDDQRHACSDVEGSSTVELFGQLLVFECLWRIHSLSFQESSRVVLQTVVSRRGVDSHDRVGKARFQHDWVARAGLSAPLKIQLWYQPLSMTEVVDKKWPPTPKKMTTQKMTPPKNDTPKNDTKKMTHTPKNDTKKMTTKKMTTKKKKWPPKKKKWHPKKTKKWHPKKMTPKNEKHYPKNDMNITTKKIWHPRKMTPKMTNQYFKNNDRKEKTDQFLRARGWETKIKVEIPKGHTLCTETHSY